MKEETLQLMPRKKEITLQTYALLKRIHFWKNRTYQDGI